MVKKNITTVHNKFSPQAGDVVALVNESKFTSVAVMTNEVEFSVCLNFRGRQDERHRVWEVDSFPSDVSLHRADKFQTAWLFAELIAQGYTFKAVHGKVTVRVDDERQSEEPDSSSSIHVERSILARNRRFAQYIYGLARLYKIQGSFRHMSVLARRNNISAVRKEVCFRIGLHKLKNIEWLITDSGRKFCDDLYEYVLHHTGTLPLIPDSQLR